MHYSRVSPPLAYTQHVCVFVITGRFSSAEPVRARLPCQRSHTKFDPTLWKRCCTRAPRVARNRSINSVSDGRSEDVRFTVAVPDPASIKKTVEPVKVIKTIYYYVVVSAWKPSQRDRYNSNISHTGTTTHYYCTERRFDFVSARTSTFFFLFQRCDKYVRVFASLFPRTTWKACSFFLRRN